MSAVVSVRLARPADARAIAGMSRELIETGLPWRWRPQRVLAAIADPQTSVAVAELQGELAAFGIMEFLDDDAYLSLLAVRSARQRQGLGSALLGWLEASARAAGARRIRLETRRDNAAARSFYNELGFHEVGIRRGRYGAGVDGLLLEKWLQVSRAPSD
ncbi:GNAT family N-acetyltransferase [Ramlibacter rhizophilus]|nr:GNAT family N-acetyltransferase [Ramlibacter rhizophilus]